MAAFQRVTKMDTLLPIGAAAAFTSATSFLLGRQTTSRTTAHISNASTKNLHTFIMNRHHHQYHHQYHHQMSKMKICIPNTSYITRRNFSSTKLSLPKQQATTTTVKDNISKSTSTPIPNPIGTTPHKKMTFVEWYESHLKSRPIPTKMVSGSILWGLGDVVAQVVPSLLFQNNDDGKNQKDSSHTSSKSLVVYDYQRTARAMIFGFGIHAPLSHAHFNLLEWMTIKGGFVGLSIPVFKTFMEQFVYWSWFSNSLYHGTMGAMQGMSPQQIYNRIADVLWDTQKAQWVFWIPVQLLNFRFVPIRHQLNVVLLTSVVWTALLSAWYPPGDEDKSLKESEEKNKSS